MTSEKQPKVRISYPWIRHSLFGVLRVIVSTGSDLAKWHRFGMAIWLLLLIITGKLFTVWGLILALIFALYILLYYLDKWLAKYD